MIKCECITPAPGEVKASLKKLKVSAPESQPQVSHSGLSFFTFPKEDREDELESQLLSREGLLETIVLLGQHGGTSANPYKFWSFLIVWITSLVPNLAFHYLTKSILRISWELVVGRGSTTSKSLGCSWACACMQPPWEIPQAPDGNNLYQMKGENKELLCLMENLSQNNLVRNYLAARAFIFFFPFLWYWLEWGDCNFFFFLSTVRSMGMEINIYIPGEFLFNCNWPFEFLWCKCECM